MFNHLACIKKFASKSFPKMIRNCSKAANIPKEPVLMKTENGILELKLNRAHKKNALTLEMFATLTNEINEASSKKDINIIHLTGTGDFFSSGNDFKDTFKKLTNGELTIDQIVDKVYDFYTAIINTPKITIAGINGPSIGLPFLAMGLFDLSYASETAWFHAPFVELGLIPEAGSGYTFPYIVGPTMMADLILNGRKLKSAEAKQFNLVVDVFPQSEFNTKMNNVLRSISERPSHSLLLSKNILRFEWKEGLHKFMHYEKMQVAENLKNPETMQSLMNFFSKI